MKFALSILVFALLAGTANADQVWNYAGNSVSANPQSPNTCGCELDATIDFASTPVLGQPFTVLSYSFTDGAFTATQANSTLRIDPFGFAQTTLFRTWSIAVYALDGSLDFWSQNYDRGYETTDIGIGGLMVQGNMGTWSDPVSTPEPSTMALVIAGLAAVTLRRKKRVDASVWEPLA
jgi:hypothetical protein